MVHGIWHRVHGICAKGTWYMAQGTCQCVPNSLLVKTRLYSTCECEGKDGRKIQHFQNEDVDINVYYYTNIYTNK
jgi:hypothetical protein